MDKSGEKGLGWDLQSPGGQERGLHRISQGKDLVQACGAENRSCYCWC